MKAEGKSCWSISYLAVGYREDRLRDTPAGDETQRTELETREIPVKYDKVSFSP